MLIRVDDRPEIDMNPTTPQPALNHVVCPNPDGKSTHRMAYWQWGDADAAHLVVCVHGLTRQGRDFDVVAQALVERAHAHGRTLRVVCPDVVGRGQSDWLSDAAMYQVPTYVGDMLAMLAQLQQQAPIQTFDWVGTSMGGLIGMGLLGTPGLPLPVAPRKVLLNDIGPVLEWAALSRIGSYVGQTGRFASVQAAADAMWALSSGFGPHTPEQWLALSRPMVKPLPGGAPGEVTLHYDPSIATPFKQLTPETAAAGDAALWQAYQNIPGEVLLLRGAQSDLLSRATADAMVQRHPRARVVEFAGVGHAPMLVVPDQQAVVLDFLLGS